MTGPIAVVVVSYNTRDLLRRCLEAVEREHPSEVVVVDNASCDGSADVVRREFPTARLCVNEVNLGYGSAANQGIANCAADYVLLLNGDVLLRLGALDALSLYLDQNPEVAIVGPRLVNLDGSLQPSCFPFPTPLDILFDVFNLSHLIRRIPVLQEAYLRTWSHSYARAVPWVLGAALAIRCKAFDMVGGFDRSFFMFYEEVDLCYRLRRAGWQVCFAPITEMIHVGSASTRQRRADMSVQFFASLVQFHRLHSSRIQQAELVALILCVALGRWIRDAVWLRLSRDPRKRDDLALNLAVWSGLILGAWRKQMGEAIPRPVGAQSNLSTALGAKG